MTPVRLTLQKLAVLEKYAAELGDELCTIRAVELVELCRSYRRNLSDLPEELQALGTFGAAFAGAFAGTVVARAPARLPEPQSTESLRAKPKAKKRKNESGPSGRGH